MLIVNGTVHTMEVGTIPSGFVQTEGTRIVRVGPMSDLPGAGDADGIIDAKGGHILPGFIDAHCHVGLYGGAAQEDDLNESPAPCTPQLRALDGVDPMNHYFREARQAGITCVLTGPGSANPIAGQSALLKTAGRVADRMAGRTPAAMKFALGENPKRIHKDGGPATRMATAALIRENLSKAQEYQAKQAKAQDDPDTDPPDFDPKLEALLPVLRGILPAHFHAHRADDIATAVRISREFGLNFAIVHGTEGYKVAPLLASAGVPVITGPCLTDRSKPELVGQTLDNPVLLAQAGVKVAICTDHPVIPIQHLPICAVRAGMDPEDALAAVTRNPAEIAGLGDRLGVLAPGRDADIVVTQGHPLDWTCRLTAVFIDGAQVDA